MINQKFLYNVNYRNEEESLCNLELKYLFEKKVTEKIFFAYKKVNPSHSYFIKNRLEILYTGQSVEELVDKIQKDHLETEDFFVKYIPLDKYDIHLKKGKEISKTIGSQIMGLSSFKSPKVVYGVIYHEERWYFGVLKENNLKWRMHQQKPHSYSSSLGISLAKALINIAGAGKMECRIIDPCCGAGTVLLEGAFAGYEMVGCELNFKVAKAARINVAHFDYDVPVTIGDIEDIKADYDAVILDLPYDNFTRADDETILKIIRNGRRLGTKVVIVSAKDISEILKLQGLQIVDYCSVPKNNKRSFSRYVWVCVSE